MDTKNQNDTVFRRRAMSGWYQALHTRLLQRVEAAARQQGQARPASGSLGFSRLATAEAPDLYRQVKELRDRL